MKPRFDIVGRYSHWSEHPVVLDKKRQYGQQRSSKPAGLWFDVNGDWRRWCESESFGATRLAYRHDLAPDLQRVLWLKNPDDIDRFTSEYRIDRYKLDWHAVANQYAGIVIAPYQWTRRLAVCTLWYYSWDCASGCVWDLTAINAFRGRKQRTRWNAFEAAFDERVN